MRWLARALGLGTPAAAARPGRMAVAATRRTRCRTCRATHVPVSTATLSRRSATIEVIGAALAAKRAGLGHRRIAARLGVPAATVRGWLRRFAVRAEQVRAVATSWAYRLDANVGRITPRGSPFDDALEALGVAVSAVVRALGPARSRWQVVAALTSGALLAPGPLHLP